MSWRVRSPSLQWLHDLDLDKAKNRLPQDRGNLCKLFSANGRCQLAGCLVLILHENVAMAWLVGEGLQAVLEAVEVLEEDLETDDLEPAPSDLVVSSAVPSKEINEALLGFDGPCIVFALKLEAQVVRGDV